MMQDRLGRADRARKAFIANASHELRTPLFSLGGYVELMREEELDEETQREFLDQMHAQITRMTRLATDLLDLSKIDTGSLAIQPEHVNLNTLARSIAREFNLRAEQQDSEIDIEVAERRRGDLRPRPRRADRAHPRRQRALTTTRRNRRDDRRGRRRDRRGAEGERQRHRASRPRTSAGSSTASTPATRPAAPASGCRSRASSRRRWRAR